MSNLIKSDSVFRPKRDSEKDPLKIDTEAATVVGYGGRGEMGLSDDAKTLKNSQINKYRSTVSEES